MKLKIFSVFKRLPFLLTLILLNSQIAFAGGGSNMPWEGPMDKITKSVSGPVAKAIAVIAIVVTGLGIAFGEGGGGMRKILWVVMGISVAFAATGTFLSIFDDAAGFTF